MSTAALRRNLQLYPWYLGASSALFWQPVFALWFSEHLDPADVLRLEALYYAAVVVLEVPSGWVSDQIGRRRVLAASSLCWALGASVMALSTHFAGLAMGQALFAAGMALSSGSDSSMLYDTLQSLGRTDELGPREGHARAVGLGSLAVAGLVGGAAGTIDLRLAYGLSAVGGLVGLALALAMTEPPAGSDADEAPASLRDPVRDPVVRWVLAYAIAGLVLVHVPYELGQPWLDALTGGRGTAALSGALGTVALLLGAAASVRAHRLRERVGLDGALLIALALQIAVVGLLALAVHPVLALALAARSVGWATAEPLLAARVHPRLDRRVRATWLSVQSLAARLAFAGTLLFTSWRMGSDPWSAPTLGTAMGPYVAGGLLALVALWLTRPGEDTAAV